MRTSSAKAKGRRLQQDVAARLRRAFPQLDDTDVRSLGMGQHGEDIQLSTRARACIGGYSFECKNQERLNVFAALEQCAANAGDHEPVVVFHKNRSDTYVALRFDKFVQLISRPNRPDARRQALRAALLGAEQLQATLQALLTVEEDAALASDTDGIPTTSETDGMEAPDELARNGAGDEA